MTIEAEGDEDAHENPAAGSSLSSFKHDEDFSYRNKTNDG